MKKKLIIGIVIILIILGLIGYCNDDSKQSTISSNESTQVETKTEKTDSEEANTPKEKSDGELNEKEDSDVVSDKATVSDDELVAKVKEVITDSVGEGESIKDVSFDGKNLVITVDMSGADTSNFSEKEIAFNRISSITDPILKLDENYYNAWETISVDFGDVGNVLLDKSMIKDEGYGKFFYFTDDIWK